MMRNQRDEVAHRAAAAEPRRECVNYLQLLRLGDRWIIQHFAELRTLFEKIREVVQLSLRGDEVELLIADDCGQRAGVTKVDDRHQFCPPRSPVS
jgi:hypothetical protein